MKIQHTPFQTRFEILVDIDDSARVQCKMMENIWNQTSTAQSERLELIFSFFLQYLTLSPRLALPSFLFLLPR